MKHFIIVLYLVSTLVANAQMRMVKGKSYAPGDPAWTAFLTKFEVVGFDSEGLLLREWTPGSVSSVQQGHTVNGRTAGGTGMVVKTYTGRWIEMVNNPYAAKASVGQDIEESFYPWIMMRTGDHIVRGIDYLVYDLGVPYAPPPPDPVPIFNGALTEAQKPDATGASQFSLATRFYLVGYGCKPDFKQAVYWLQKAEDQNYLGASNKLWELSVKNKKAATTGNTNAINHLVILKPWLTKISGEGNEQATDILSSLKE